MLRICVGSVAVAVLALLVGAGTTSRAQTPSPTGSQESFDLRNGYRYTSSDGELELHIGGVYAGQVVGFDSRNKSSSGFRSEIIRPIIEGTVGDRLSFRVAPDLLGLDTRFNMDEAWISYDLMPQLRLTGGLIHMPSGFESWFLEDELSMIGWAFPIYLDRRTDLGVALTGELQNGWLTADARFGFGKGFSIIGDKQEEESASIRMAVFPLLRDLDPNDPEPPEWWRGVFGGIGYTYSDDYKGRLKLQTPAGTTLFTVPRFEADSSDFLSWTAGIDAGPVRVAGSMVTGGYTDVRTALGDQDMDQVKSWETTVNWMLTGERYATRAYRQISPRQKFPARPMDGTGSDKGYGAVEIGLRYSNMDIDRDFFNFGFTSFTQSSQEARTFSSAVHWYPISNIRFSAAFVRTLADDDPAALGGHDRDNTWMFQGQYQF
jgi:hypothetical protein